MSVDVAPKRPKKTARPHQGEELAAPAPEHKRPPRSLSVVSDPSPQESRAAIDWSPWYLTDEEDMGQSAEQDLIIRVFTSALEMHARERAWQSHIGNAQFFAWVHPEPLVRVSPDVFVLDDPPQPLPRMWELWRPGIRPPRFALEVVSEDWKKDYEQSPLKYDQLGAGELVIFDPEAARGSAPQRRRVPLQIYRRQADGSFERVAQGDGPFRSEELGAWLAVRFEGIEVRLRIARDATGFNLVPTQEEARLEAERRQLQEQQARQEAERQQRKERLAREQAEQKQAAAEQQLAAALAELERLRKQAAK